MFVIAVTGGLGAGKSEAAGFFETRGAVVLDLDELAKDLLHADPVVHDAVVAAFGNGVLDAEGVIRRDRLAEEAFRCEATATTLGGVVHPHVIDAVERRLEELALQGRPPALVVIEVPLLVEAPALVDKVDLVLAIEAPEAIRVARAVGRGMSEDEAGRRIAVQADDAARAGLADVILVNDDTPEIFRKRLGAVWEDRIAPAAEPTSADEE